MTKRKDTLHPDAPLKLTSHSRPRTRREFIAQSFAAGSGLVIASSLAGLFSSRANAALSPDLAALVTPCTTSGGGGGATMLPFICFDLAGGANIAGSNVLVGGRGGALDDPLSLQGYSRLGLPAAMVPNKSAGTFFDTSLGVPFHSDSAFLRGIKLTCSADAMLGVNGAVIPARSENDTGNNPHNPMYAIHHAGSRGDLVNLVGSQNSDSGGNSMAPSMLIDIGARPTQVTRPSDVTALVGTSTSVPDVLGKADTVAAMESIVRISNQAIDSGQARYHLNGANTTERDAAKCEILKSADGTDKFGGSSSTNILSDPFIVGGGSLGPIFTDAGGLMGDSEFMKTAAIMKLVIDGASPVWPSKRFASAGTITMGGFDYHTGDRRTGEARDLRAGKCMGACIEYAHRRGIPLMLYVFSDGAVSSNGGIDAMANDKLNWDSDNQQTGAAFFLVYKPGTGERRIAMRTQQLGWMRPDASVETAGSPGANSVTQLVDMVTLNYLALQGRENLMSTALLRPESSILGGSTNWANYIAVGGTIT